MSIPLLDDEIIEDIEIFWALLSISETSQMLGPIAGPDYIATVNITDKFDISSLLNFTVTVTPIIEVNFSPVQYKETETIGSVILILTANSQANIDYTVLVETSDGSAVGKLYATFTLTSHYFNKINSFKNDYLTDGEDYAGGQYEALFIAHSTTSQVQIPIYDDREFEGDESFTAQLSILPGTEGVIAGSDDEATINIADNEQETFVNFSPTQYTVSEDGNFAILNVTASAPASHAYEVHIQTNEGSAKGENALCTSIKQCKRLVCLH